MDFEGYVRERGQALLRFAYLLTGSLATAEDVTQSALTDTFRHWTRISRTDHPDAYVRRVILNTYLADRRRRWSTEIPAAFMPDQAAPSGMDPETRVVSSDAFRRVIANLPPRSRAVIILRYYLDLKDSETAEMLGITESTVRSTVTRALDSLRTTLAWKNDD
jgi:RNA polymerase sigma-70 factor (sigma-E family)